MTVQGKIISVVAGAYTVYLSDATTVTDRPKGKFRYRNIRPCVGDDVRVSENRIVEILPRKNCLIRPTIVNLDLGIVVVSMRQPEYSSYLLDKFLSMLFQYQVEPLIVLSKADLEEDDARISQIIGEYQSAGITAVAFSDKTKEGVETIRGIIAGKTIAFMGQTGVGKSTLINAICPEAARKVGEYSKTLNRGKHQTKEVRILPYEGGFIADTPGFSSLELNCFKEELPAYFPFFKGSEPCFFPDCMHINEPKCGILARVAQGRIPREHYENYRMLSDGLIYRKDRFNK